MKLLDEKGKLFGLINIIDLLVLVLVIAIVAGGAYHLTRPDKPGITGPGGKEVVVLALVSDVSQYTVDAVQPGSHVYDPTSKSYMGEVVDVQVTPHRDAVETADGRVVMAEVPERFDLLVSYKGNAQVSESTVRLASYDMRVGASISVASRDFMILTTVLRVDIVE